MSFELGCRCGKRFRAEETLRGESVLCPACGQAMQPVAAARPDQASPKPAAPPPATPPAAASGDRVTVTCSCGGRFAADSSLSGRRVRCPKCSNILTVPAAQPQAAYELVLDDDPFGDLGLSSTADPLMSKPPRPVRSSSTSMNPLLLVGIFGGGGLLVVLVVVVAVMFSGGGSMQTPEVATQAVEMAPWLEDNSPAPTNPSPTPQAPSASPGNSSQPPLASNSGGADQASPFKPVAPTPPDSADNATRPAGPKPAAGKFERALDQWHTNRSAIAGARREDNSEVVVLKYSWMPNLLPHLGYDEVYAKFEFQKPWTENPNLTLSTAVIPEFLNPVDNRDRWEGSPFDKLGLTHFVGISGIEDARNVVAAELPRSDPRAGVFGYDDIVRRDEIKDGSSNTLMIVGAGELTGPWISGGGATVRGARQPYFDKLSGFGTRGAKPGTMAMFADGATRFISEDIDPQVFAAMCTVGGSESVDLGKLAAPEPRYPTKASAER